MGPEEVAGFLRALGPTLRDTLFLIACGITGVCVPMAGLLAGVRREAVCGTCGAAVLGAAALSWNGGASLPQAAGALTLLGVLGMGVLWWIAVALSPVRRIL